MFYRHVNTYLSFKTHMLAELGVNCITWYYLNEWMSLQVLPSFWWWRWCIVGRRYEQCNGWQQTFDSSKWRTHSCSKSLQVIVWGDHFSMYLKKSMFGKNINSPPQNSLPTYTYLDTYTIYIYYIKYIIYIHACILEPLGWGREF